jgi:hypothetical protein
MWGEFFRRLREVAGEVACEVGRKDGRFVDVAGARFWTAPDGRSEGGLDYDTVDQLCANKGGLSVHYKVVGDVVVVTGIGVVRRFSIADVTQAIQADVLHGWKHGQGNVVSRAITRRAGCEWGAETP